MPQAIAAAGVASRRGADDLIFGGQVKVNGKVVTEPGTQVDLRKDRVRARGAVVVWGGWAGGACMVSACLLVVLGVEGSHGWRRAGRL